MTRVECEAAFRIGLNQKVGKWIVKEFIGEHDRHLVDVINTQFLRSHRVVSNPDKTQVDVMRKAWLKQLKLWTIWSNNREDINILVSHKKIYTIILMQSVEWKLKMVM